MPPRKTPKVDRISALPDTVLSHVLSFLPTKHAVTTSVLSKRWKHLWRTVWALDLRFHDLNWSPHSELPFFRFKEFVYSVLLLLDAAQSIQKFCLRIESNHIHFDFYEALNKWVNVVLQRRVEYLNLNLFSVYRTQLPLVILRCKTLVVLKLRMFIMRGLSSVELPSLKVLYLECVTFPKHRCLVELLVRCPILEDLRAYSLSFCSQDSLTNEEFKSLSFPKLTRVEIGSYLHLPLIALHAVEFLLIDIDKGYCSFDDIPVFHNLIHLELFFEFHRYDWNLLVEMLNHCPKLQNLGLNETDYNLSGKGDEENWVDPEFVPECLSLHLKTCTFRNYDGLQCELSFARYIMKNARVLHTMTIECTYILCDDKTRFQKIKRGLSLCQKSSATCKLSVY